MNITTSIVFEGIMHYILFFILIAFVFLVLLYWKSRVYLEAHLDPEGFIADIYLLRSSLRVHLQISEIAILSAYLFKLRLYKKQIFIKTKGRSKRLIKSVDFSDIAMDVSYGLHDPFSTATAYGAMMFLREFLPANIKRMDCYPAFSQENDFVYISANGYLNVWQTIRKYLKSNKEKHSKKWITST
jgi:hypothetical protein